MTWTSTAAGRPRFQLGSRTSAGLTEESGNRLGASFEGARAADWAAHGIVTRNTISITTTANLMITKGVSRDLVLRAGELAMVEGNP